MTCDRCGKPVPADAPDVTVTEAGVEYTKSFCGAGCLARYLKNVYGEALARELGDQIADAIDDAGVANV